MKAKKTLLMEIAEALEAEPATALPLEQRQRERRQYFATRKGFDPAQYFVAPIPYRAAFDFVTTHHYSGSFAADIVRLGMFHDRPFRPPKLVGVAIFGLGAGPKTLKKYLGSLRPLELVRFVLLDGVGYRGETWFLARAFEIVRKSSVQKEALAHHGGRYLLDHPVQGVLAFSDPVPRTTASGRIIMPGHVGSIYQSKSAVYAGRGEAHKTNILLPDGSVVDKRQQSKLTRQETGAESVYLKLVQAGARRRRRGETWAAWLGDVKRRPPFRLQIHPGTHAFVWKLGGKRRSLRSGDFPPGHRRPATVAERHSLVQVIQKLQRMERKARGLEREWLESEILEMKERLAGMELVRPENWPGYPKKIDPMKTVSGQRYYYFLEDAAPATRASSPAKRATVEGEKVDKVPFVVALKLAKVFATSYLPGAQALRINDQTDLFGPDWAYGKVYSTSPQYGSKGRHLILAGSMRRHLSRGRRFPTVGDLDFVLVAPSFQGLRQSVPGLKTVSGGDRMRTYRFTSPVYGKTWDMQVNVMRADPEELGATLMYATGPGGWNALMRTKAKRMGLKLNRYGLFETRTGHKVAGETEKGIFDEMGKAWKYPWERGK